LYFFIASQDVIDFLYMFLYNIDVSAGRARVSPKGIGTG
jgi:hypothetical protein